MLFKNISILTEDYKIEKHMYVLTSGSTITYVGKDYPENNTGRVIDGRHKLLMPAFYNAHCHTPMTILRGYAENLQLEEWLHKKIFPFEAKLTPGMVYNSTLLGIAEMFRAGVVSATDMYLHGEAALSAYENTGAKVNFNAGTVCFDDKAFKDLKEYRETDTFVRNFHGKHGGRILIDMGLHSEYTTTPRVCQEAVAYAKEHGLRMVLHLAETRQETDACKERHGKTPTQYFNDMGLFDLPTTAAHCIYTNKTDRAILAEKKVYTAVCPNSNLKLDSGFPAVSLMLKDGMRVALGTDGAASNNSLGMFDEMKTLILAIRVFMNDPAALTPEQVLAIATRNGALSQGRLDCGLIKEGYKADFCVLDIDKPNFYPEENLINHLIYSAENRDVVMTVCDGNIVYKDGEYSTIDMERVAYSVERDYKRVVEQL